MSRILLVEDEPLIAMMLTDWLADLGHDVVGTAAKCKEAEALVDQERPDFAILDYLLIDGPFHPVAAKLKSLSVPFVVVSGAMIDGEGEDLSGVDILTKPIDFEKLAQSLHRAGVPVVHACSGAS